MTVDSSNQQGMKKILVIDDDRETCDFLTEIFSLEGWSVQAAQTAEAGLALAASAQFDCVVTDINLNDRLTGLDLLRAIRQRRPATEVVLISGFGTLDTAVEAVRGEPSTLSPSRSTFRRSSPQ